MQKGNSIIKFSGEHYFLDNFYKCQVTYDGITYKSSEAAFQAQKAPAKERYKFAELDKPAEVKKLGGKHGPFAMKQNSAELIAWQKRSPEVMEEVVRAKFNQNPDLAEKLIATGDLHLVEGNNHDDNLYGIQLKRVPGTRKKLLVDKDGCYILSQEENEHNNHLGKILMKVREELKQSKSAR